MRRTCRALVVATLAMAAVSNAVGQQADATFERQFAVGGPLDVEVATGSGAIAVRHSESGEVRVRGSLHIRNSGGSPAFFRGGSRLSDDDAEELIRQFETDPPVELAGGRLRVGSDDREWQHGVRIDYEIEVPAASAVTARTGSGRLEIDDIDGDVTARTGSGSIRIGDVAGRVQARSGSGAITASSIAGDFEGHAGSGSMDISLVGPGDVTVSTGSGSIDVDGVQGGLSARTGSGGVTVAGRPAAEWNLTTGSGSVRLRLPNDAQFELDAKAGSGGVSSDHPVTVQGAIDRGRLTGQVRGGGPLVVARTGSGGIRIE